MITIIGAVILIVAALGSVWYTIRTTGRTQAAVEASAAAKEAADKRVLELEKTVADQAIIEKARDAKQVDDVTTAAGAVKWLQDSITAGKRPH